ncbi:hypothetical protein ACKI1Q_41560 [Streptomyces galilaeus]|uniref:hypothetical protein n=1 Tax=Streptomyces galilaeus TaxID=33899 RepID=UPI0038F7E6CB
MSTSSCEAFHVTLDTAGAKRPACVRHPRVGIRLFTPEDLGTVVVDHLPEE